jgi:outer membrane protein OmpA-like peptidoglycan-associated protein
MKASIVALCLIVAATAAAQSTPPPAVQRTTLSAVVYFEPGVEELTDEAKSVLDALVAKTDGMRIEGAIVIGFADRGNGEFALAQTRARMVRDYLVSGGIDAGNFHVEAQESYTEPDATGIPETPAQRKQASRIEVQVAGVRAAVQ